MKKTICLILSVLLFFSLAIPAMAADVAVAFTSDSGFTVGDTVKVHINRIRNKISIFPEIDVITVRGLGYRGVKNA